MPGKNFIKVTSVIFILMSIVSIFVYTVAGLIFELAATDTGEKMGWLFVVMCLIYTGAAIVQFVAGVKGIKGCDKKEAAPDLRKWGTIILAVALLAGASNLIQSVMSGGALVSGIVTLLFGCLFPILYVHGASMNERA